MVWTSSVFRHFTTRNNDLKCVCCNLTSQSDVQWRWQEDIDNISRHQGGHRPPPFHWGPAESGPSKGDNSQLETDHPALCIAHGLAKLQGHIHNQQLVTVSASTLLQHIHLNRMTFVAANSKTRCIFCEPCSAEKFPPPIARVKKFWDVSVFVSKHRKKKTDLRYTRALFQPSLRSNCRHL